MMGRRERGQGQFFYEFHLDDVVPPDHLVREIKTSFDQNAVFGKRNAEDAKAYAGRGKGNVGHCRETVCVEALRLFSVGSRRQVKT